MKIVKKEITPKSTIYHIIEYRYEKENIRLLLPEKNRRMKYLLPWKNNLKYF